MEPKIKEKRWEKHLEKGLLEKWSKEGLYKFDAKNPKPFVIDTPPPYPSGRPWHIGAAAHYSQIDMIARTARMMGHAVYFPLGIDRNGLPVELYTEKKNNVRLHEMPREKFVELCQESLDDLEAEMLGIMKSMGMSCDFENYYRTDSEQYRTLTQSTFIELWNKDFIYEDTRPNNVCLDCGTTIADAEIVYQELPTELIYIKFKVNGKDLIIATTRPELLCSCQMIMVNNNDERYKQFIGKAVTIPLYNRKIKLIDHPYPDPAFGSGVVMICSYGDQNDVQLFRKLKLKEIIAIDLKGKMTDAAGPYKGMAVKEARKKIIEDLEKKGLVVKKEKINHRTPICERSKTIIEIIPMKEFYLKQVGLKDKIWYIARKTTFHPERHRQILRNWIDSITMDWPISRRRYYATEVPIWYCKECKKPLVPEPGKYYRPWKDKPPFSKCECGCSEFIGEERTFDTWMDSSVSPLFLSKYGHDKEFFSKAFPNTIRPQGKEIVRTWLYYTLLRCYQLTKKQAFNHVWIMGYGVDEKGKKMSKSKGNVIDPIPIIDNYGADVFRFWNAAEVNLGGDFRCSEEKMQGTSKFLTKLWNVSRFISSFPFPKKPKLTETDEWILSELSNTIKEGMKGYKEFNFFPPANTARNFLWNVFAPHYLEMIKPRAYGNGFTKEEQEAAQYTLHHCLKSILTFLAPITPFITDYVHREIYGSTVHKEPFPATERAKKIRFTTEELIDLNSSIWKLKKDKGLSLKTPLNNAVIPSKFRSLEKDMKATHNIENLSYGNLKLVLGN